MAVIKLIKLDKKEGERQIKLMEEFIEKRKKFLKSIGAKSTEGFYVKNNKARSIVDG